ncbi:MAG: hypothetical protein HZC01_01760 [Candidatus Kerfeldbacteria bacterium]|nr:hypothetical protein [Candidatus Kerfeldbacteria bacterium]
MKVTSEPAEGDPSHSSQSETLDSLKAAVMQKSPILAEIVQEHGNKNLRSYTRNFLEFSGMPQLDARRSELISVTRELVGQRLGDSVGEAVAQQLRDYPLVSTTDHHGPIDHPFFVNANLIGALSYDRERDATLNHLVVFSFASVSVNNASAYPRGLLVHGGMNGSGNLLRIPILPDKEKMGVVWKTRAYTAADIARAHQLLDKKLQSNDIMPERHTAVKKVVDDFFADSEVLSEPDLNAQITQLNYKLWPQLFRNEHQSTSATPDLVYLEIETLVTELLTRFHFNNPESPLYRLLFEKSDRDAALEHCDGIPGGFNNAQATGTHFFWALNDRAHRKRMALEGDTLHAADMDLHVPLTPEAITEGLRTKQLMPSMLLCYQVVALYYGMKCLGGFSQVSDLTRTKAAWIKVLENAGLANEAAQAATIPTATYGGDGLVLAYLQTISGSLVPATGIDMLLGEGTASLEHFRALAEKVTLNEMLYAMLPEIYSVFYTAEQRDAALQAITPEQILEQTGLRAKLTLGAQTMRTAPATATIEVPIRNAVPAKTSPLPQVETTS